MLDEHAVSEVKLGPRRSKKCEIRLDCMAYAHPGGPNPSVILLDNLPGRVRGSLTGRLMHGDGIGIPE